MTTATQNANGDASPFNAPFKIIGTRPIRPDGVDKVTGRAIYGADVHLPGMLYGKVLRSPYAHARIRSIDVEAARQIPGVPRSSPRMTCQVWETASKTWVSRL